MGFDREAVMALNESARMQREKAGRPLTPEWLSANGWKLTNNSRNDGRSDLEGMRRRQLGRDVVQVSSDFPPDADDLCVDVAPRPGLEGWYCWIVRASPYQLIHVRVITTTGDLSRLYEGLTGRTFKEAPAPS